MRDNKLIKYQLVILFLLIIITPSVLDITGVTRFERVDENRVFNDSISINFKKLDKFPPGFDAYSNDNFFFRTPMLNYFHRMKFNVFNISPHPEKAIIGKDGWLFKSGIELELLKGDKGFSIETLDSFKNEWKERTRYLEERNIPVFWIIAPMKHRIYTDKLPYNINISENNRVETLKSYLKDEFPNLIIDPSEKLKALKDSENLYYKLDNHWNPKAAFYTTQLLIERLKTEFPDKNIIDIPELRWESEEYSGGYHYNVMGIDELSETLETPVFVNPRGEDAEKFGFESVPGFPYPQEFETRFINKKLENGLRVLFIRDSFGGMIQPFAKEVFSESVFIFDAWQFKMNETIIEEFKPDVVIFIGLETNVENYLKTFE